MPGIENTMASVIEHKVMPPADALLIFTAAISVFTRRMSRVEFQSHADPCQQFFYCKWFRDVIDCSRVKSRYFVHHRVPGGEKDHRYFFLSQKPSQHFQPVKPRKHDIQKDEIIVVLKRHVQRLPSVTGFLDRVSLMHKFQFNEPGKFFFIFHKKNCCCHPYTS